MPKQPIEWHISCLNNMRRTLRTAQERLNKEADAVNDLRQRTQFYAAQVERARRLKKDGFDPDRFGITQW